MDDKSEQCVSCPAKDTELDALLDDALQDFEKPLSSNAGATGCDLDDQKCLWNDEFLSQTVQEVEITMRQLGMSSGEEDHSEIASCLRETIKSLQDDVSFPVESALNEMLKKLDEDSNNNSDSDQEDGFASLSKSLSETLPFMGQMLKTLLSKQLMYTPIKEITEAYPKWLKENENTLSSEDYTRYNSQLSLITNVCKLYEEESENEPESVKQKRYLEIMDIMVKIQELGHPPEIIAGKLPGMDFDIKDPSSSGNLVDGCGIM